MEITLRCAVADRPGALAELAGVIGAAGADIEAVDVVDVTDGVALDDLVVVVRDPAHLQVLLEALRALPEASLVHAAPSRGHPGDAVTRLAVGLESILSGAMHADSGLTTLVGGLLRADAVDLLDPADAPRERDGVIVIPLGERCAVVRRSYPFTRTERERALALARACQEAARQLGQPLR